MAEFNRNQIHKTKDRTGSVRCYCGTKLTESDWNQSNISTYNSDFTQSFFSKLPLQGFIEESHIVYIDIKPEIPLPVEFDPICRVQNIHTEVQTPRSTVDLTHPSNVSLTISTESTRLAELTLYKNNTEIKSIENMNAPLSNHSVTFRVIPDEFIASYVQSIRPEVVGSVI